MIVLDRARAAAKSMTEEAFEPMNYGDGSACPRCLVGHLLPSDRLAMGAMMAAEKPFHWINPYEGLCPVPHLDEHDEKDRLSWEAMQGYQNARNTLAYMIRACRKYQRQRRMAIVRDLLKQEGDRQLVRNAQRMAREKAVTR